MTIPQLLQVARTSKMEPEATLRNETFDLKLRLPLQARIVLATFAMSPPQAISHQTCRSKFN